MSVPSLVELTIDDSSTADDLIGSQVRQLADNAGYQTKPLSKVPLLVLIPLEIRENIYHHVLGGEEVVVDLTTSRGVTHQLKLGTPDVFIKAKSLLTTNKMVHVESKATMFRYILYVNRNADSQERLPGIIQGNCSLIRRFELRLNFKTKCSTGATWPGLLVSLLQLPNLEFMRLYSTSERDKPAYSMRESGDQDGTVTKHEQEYRALILLGSFIILRHPNLDVMIEPALNGADVVDDNDCFVHEFRLVKYYPNAPPTYNKVFRETGYLDEEHKPDFEMLEDRIVNTTAVREVKWQELCTYDRTKLYAQPRPGQSKKDVATSEQLTPGHHFFATVDQRAYQPASLFAARGWTTARGLGTYNGLITKARAEARRSAAGEARAETAARLSQEQDSRSGGHGRGHSAQGRGRGRGSNGESWRSNTVTFGSGTGGNRGRDWKNRAGASTRGGGRGRGSN